MSDDEKRPSIAELQRLASQVLVTRTALSELASAAPVLLEIVAAALAYRKAQKKAAIIRARPTVRYWADVDRCDKQEIRCRDAFEAALAKVRE